MKNIKRTLITVLAMLLVCVLSVSATLAYLYAKTATVRNTFSVGNVEITLDEAHVDPYGNFLDESGNVVADIANANRVVANQYKLMDGKTYSKDPTVHVSKYSEESYIFVEVVVDPKVAAALVENGENSISEQMA